MPVFKVTETTSIESIYKVEAKDAKSAINKARLNQHSEIPKQSLDQKFIASEIKEEK